MSSMLRIVGGDTLHIRAILETDSPLSCCNDCAFCFNSARDVNLPLVIGRPFLLLFDSVIITYLQ